MVTVVSGDESGSTRRGVCRSECGGIVICPTLNYLEMHVEGTVVAYYIIVAIDGLRTSPGLLSLESEVKCNEEAWPQPWMIVRCQGHAKHGGGIAQW